MNKAEIGKDSELCCYYLLFHWSDEYLLTGCVLGTGLNTSKHPFISFNPYNEGKYDHCTVKGTAANQELK